MRGGRRIQPKTLVIATMAAGVLVVATACTATSGTGFAAGATPSTAGPSTSTIEVPGLPDVEPGLRTLVALSAQAGSSQPTDITVVPGDVVATMRCTGGPLEMHLDGLAWATVQCNVGGVSPVRNVFNVHEGAKVKVYIKAGAGVRWNLRVAQR